MNPTFNLSAAKAPVDAVPPTMPASRSAAAAARNVFLIINLQTVGVNQSSRTWRPIAHARNFKSAVGYEHGSERGRRGRAAGTRAREQHQYDDGCKIGQGRHELGRDSDAGALRVQLQDRDG